LLPSVVIEALRLSSGYTIPPVAERRLRIRNKDPQ
jgi:hypothetical protein